MAAIPKTDTDFAENLQNRLKPYRCLKDRGRSRSFQPTTSIHCLEFCETDAYGDRGGQ